MLEKSSLPIKTLPINSISVGGRAPVAGRWLWLVAILLLAGVGARCVMWEAFPVMRSWDMANRWAWGRISSERGVVAVIDETADDLNNGRPPRHGRIDYMPLRLWAMEGWYRISMARYPGTTQWQDDLGFIAPLLTLNAVAELIASGIAAWIVIELGGSRGKALACATMIWLNPMVIVVGYGVPQWDSWSAAICLGATLAVLKGRWGLAGALVALGILIKGQSLAVVPFFVLVPLLRKQWGDAARWTLGLGLGMLVGLAPWLMHASLAPLRVGILYGAEKFDSLARRFCENLPQLASYYLGWQPHQLIMGFVPVEAILIAPAVSVVFLAAWWTTRGPDWKRAFVLGTAIFWLAMYVFMPRMTSRYLIWAAICMAAPAVLNYRLLFAWAALSAIGPLTLVLMRLQGRGRLIPPWSALVAIHPHAAWLVLACLVLALLEMRRLARSAGPGIEPAAAGNG